MSDKIICPKCASDQLTSNKKGFSGKKAVTGAVLTGGLGLLAGTLGSNTVKITCLACGNEFKPGEGKVISDTPNNDIEQVTDGNFSNTIPADHVEFIINRIREAGMLSAVTSYKNYANISLEDSKKIVDDVSAKTNTTTAKPGCAGIVVAILLIFILTAII